MDVGSGESGLRARHGRIWCREGELDLDGRGGAEESARTCPGTSGVGTLRASLGLRRWGRRREHLSPRRAKWTFPRNHFVISPRRDQLDRAGHFSNGRHARRRGHGVPNVRAGPQHVDDTGP